MLNIQTFAVSSPDSLSSTYSLFWSAKCEIVPLGKEKFNLLKAAQREYNATIILTPTHPTESKPIPLLHCLWVKGYEKLKHKRFFPPTHLFKPNFYLRIH